MIEGRIKLHALNRYVKRKKSAFEKDKDQECLSLIINKMVAKLSREREDRVST